MNTTNKAYVPAAIVAALDEYGPILKWFGHWTDFEVGSVFYSVPAKHAEEVARSPLLLTPRTFGGFSGAFYVAKGRKPTEQEIFDAGVRSGLARAEEAKPAQAIERVKAFLAAYDTTDMDDAIMGVILEGDKTVDLLASDLRKLLGLPEAQRKKETCKPGGCSAIGCEGGHYCFRPDGTPIVVTPEKRQELERALSEVFNIAYPVKGASNATSLAASSSAQSDPPHPGETLREDVLPNLGLSVEEAAAKVGVATEVFQGVLDGRVSINAEMALRIERWLGVENGGSASTWLALQGAYDLWYATRREG
jgi:addiction module HigA family antidote